MKDSESGFLICCHVGQFLNGCAGVMVLSMPPLVSAVWFPDRERIFATAYSQVKKSVTLKHFAHKKIKILNLKSWNFLGVALASLVGPLAVPFDDKYNDDDAEVPDRVVQDTRVTTHEIPPAL